jgi:hypothetical protein
VISGGSEIVENGRARRDDGRREIERQLSEGVGNKEMVRK